MAGLTHMAVGLAAKPAAPKTPLAILIVGAYTIDILWGVFSLMGIKSLSNSGADPATVWSHSLFMAIIWTLLAGLLSWLISRNLRLTLVMSVLVFSHWLIDFISHPMTAVFPDAKGLPLFFNDSVTIGLGLWRTQLAVNVGEYGALILGLMIYMVTFVYLRKQQNQTERQVDSHIQGDLL